MASRNVRQGATPSDHPGNANAENRKKDSTELYRIQVLDRAARILEAFSFERPELSVSEISAATRLHKSTAHRILMALEYNGLVAQNPQTLKYCLGIKLFKLGQQAVSRLNLRDVARPYLRALMEETGETVHLAVLDHDQVLYLEKVEGPHALRMPSRVGRHIPTYCTSLGKALLSCLEDGEVRRILESRPIIRYTPNTVKNVEDLLTELKRTRRRGYAVDNEEIELGLRCAGAPIRDYSGELVGAISVAGPSARLAPDKIAVAGNVVVRVATAISRQLGYDAEKRLEETRAKEGVSVGRLE